MAKDTERRLAQVLFVNEGKLAKEIAAQLVVNEHTIGEWVRKGNWKDLRAAHVNAPDRLVANLRELINTLTERRLELERIVPVNDEHKAQIAEEKVSIADQVSKYNKALENAQDENRVGLGVYIRVCEDIFPRLHQAFPKMTKEFAEFQRKHIEEIAARYA